MKVVAIGRSEFLYNAIVEASKHHEVCAIITSKANAEYSRDESDFEALATEIGAKYFFTNQINEEILEFVATQKPDVGISINWLSLIGNDFISQFRCNVLNAHFGDLPKYRGNAVLNWAILRGECEAVLSIHSMIPNILDLGDIYAQERFVINDNTYIHDLLSLASEKLAHTYTNALLNIELGKKIKSLSMLQKEIGFRCHSRLPKDGLIDWNQSAIEICRLIRSVSKPFPGAFTYFSSNESIIEIKIWRARCAQGSCTDIAEPGQVIARDVASGEVSVLTGNGVIILEEIQPKGIDSSIPPAAYIKSTRARLGINMHDLMNCKFS